MHTSEVMVAGVIAAGVMAAGEMVAGVMAAGVMAAGVMAAAKRRGTPLAPESLMREILTHLPRVTTVNAITWAEGGGDDE
jgi:hypothetical protein